ncbi:MAG TPA: RDD family protein [Terriglobia bacterium]|nr:RDD family protein [Terriglobia bacterium]
MKCPKCGFVSHPGLPQCKRCGRQFNTAPRKENPSLISSLLSSSSPVQKQAASDPSSTVNNLPSLNKSETSISAASITPERASTPGPASIAGSPAIPRVPAQPATPLWQDELSGRVQKFRRQRARLRSNFDPSGTLDLEFDSTEDSPPGEIETLVGGQVVEFGEGGREVSTAVGDSAHEHSVLDSLPQASSGGGIRVLSGAAVQAGEMHLSHPDTASDPVEIIIDSEPPTNEVLPHGARFSSHPRELMAPRFLAALLDATILMAGNGVFAAIFWYFCLQTGRVSPVPASLIVTVAVAAFFMLFYFGLAVALTGSTPGLTWMGLEVRNQEGNLPTTLESWWRAFGYLVSASAFFMGFLWAFLDPDGLTWHDLISGTYITDKSVEL